MDPDKYKPLDSGTIILVVVLLTATFVLMIYIGAAIRV